MFYIGFMRYTLDFTLFLSPWCLEIISVVFGRFRGNSDRVRGLDIKVEGNARIPSLSQVLRVIPEDIAMIGARFEVIRVEFEA
jgi:hypothetical protein